MGGEGKATMNTKCHTVIALLNQRWVFFICVLFVLPASAQQYNFNIGVGLGFPLARTSDFASTSYNFVAGGGPNTAMEIGAYGFVFKSDAGEALLPAIRPLIRGEKFMRTD
jgi:hypothetical protein